MDFGSREFEIRNAIIKSAWLGIWDHHLTLGSWISLQYEGGGQGFGGWHLYVPKGFDNHKVDGVAGHWIYRVLECAGTESWADLPGKAVRARISAKHGKVEAIGHIVKDIWFYPQEEFGDAKRSSCTTGTKE